MKIILFNPDAALVKGAKKFQLRLSGRKDVLFLNCASKKVLPKKVPASFLQCPTTESPSIMQKGGWHLFRAGTFFGHLFQALERAVERAAQTAKVKIKPREVFVIGDTHRDVEAAKEAGYHSGVVLDGLGDRRLLMRSNPELMAKDFSELKPWLIWLGLKKDPKGVSRGAYICPDSPIEHAHYGRTGADLRDIEPGMKRLREAKKKITGRIK